MAKKLKPPPRAKKPTKKTLKEELMLDIPKARIKIPKSARARSLRPMKATRKRMKRPKKMVSMAQQQKRGYGRYIEEEGEYVSLAEQQQRGWGRYEQALGETREIDIVSRKGQPQIRTEIPVYTEQAMGGPVSSSWIAALYWKGFAVMELLNDYNYKVYIPWRMFIEWYYAHSKGTFFNSNIKDKFKVVRS